MELMSKLADAASMFWTTLSYGERYWFLVGCYVVISLIIWLLQRDRVTRIVYQPVPASEPKPE